jgi:hypothetical protein
VLAPHASTNVAAVHGVLVEPPPAPLLPVPVLTVVLAMVLPPAPVSVAVSPQPTARPKIVARMNRACVRRRWVFIGVRSGLSFHALDMASGSKEYEREEVTGEGFVR